MYRGIHAGRQLIRPWITCFRRVVFYGNHEKEQTWNDRAGECAVLDGDEAETESGRGEHGSERGEGNVFHMI